MSKAQGSLPLHEHRYVTGPEARKPRKPGDPHILHAHEGGERGHKHPDTGPASYVGGIKRAKRRVRPVGPQLPYIERTAEERTFTVVFVDEYTDGHASAGISRERWEEDRASFIDLMRGGNDFDYGNAADRMAKQFDMQPIYELRSPKDDRAQNAEVPR